MRKKSGGFFPAPDIEAEIEIAAPRAAVWRVLTDPEALPGWLYAIHYTGRPGETFHIQPNPVRRAAGDITDATHAEIELLETPDRFGFTWYLPGTPKTHVRFDLEEADGATSVRLRHAGWDQFRRPVFRAIRDGLASAWTQSLLPALKTACEEAETSGS